VPLAIAAYKMGPAAVMAAHGVPIGGNYVERVMAVYNSILRAVDPLR
jgi:hypothetical protein